MTFPKFHGIQLAANSWVKNLSVEHVAADPALIRAGQIWLNTADGVLKYSALQGDTLVSLSIFDKASAEAASAVLQSSISTVSSTLDAKVVAETTARIAALNVMTLALQAETLARTTAIADAALIAANSVAEERSARIAADAVAAATAADQLATETAARLAGDVALDGRVDAVQAELNATQVGSGLDVSGAYIAPTTSAFINSATSLANATALLDAALSTEAAARQGADAALSSAIANEAQLRTDGDLALENRITAYVNGALVADETQDALEVQRRIDGDAALQAEIDRTQAAIGLDSAGNLIPISGTSYLDTATTVFGGAAILDIQLARVDAALTGEIATRSAAIELAAQNLQAETLARQTSDTAQQQEINRTQAGAGLEADGAYIAPTGSNYLAAATSLKDASFKLDAVLKSEADKIATLETVTVPALQSSVTAEKNRAQAAEQALQDSINQANTSGSTATTNLKAAINAGRYTVKTAAAALVHVIAHNLNTEFVQYTIMVEGEDLVYRNDIVPVEEIGVNSFRVTLTEARKIKVSVINASALV